MPATTAIAVISTGPRCTVRGQRVLTNSRSWSGIASCLKRASGGPSKNSKRRRYGYGRWLSDETRPLIEKQERSVNRRFPRERRFSSKAPTPNNPAVLCVSWGNLRRTESQFANDHHERWVAI